MLISILYLLPYLTSCETAIDKLSYGQYTEEQVQVCSLILQESDTYEDLNKHLLIAVVWHESMFFMNDNATARTLNIFVVQSGASPATTNQIIKAVSIDGGDTYVINLEKLVLDNGDTIVATASAGSSIYGTISSVTI